jgi:hypothetical protein
MADTIRKVEHFSIQVPNAPAKAFGVLSTLVSAGINLLACSGVPRGRRAQIDVVPDNARRFKTVVKKAGLSFTPEKGGFMIQGKDRAGALTGHLKKLGDKGINVTGIDALSAGEGRWGAIIWVEDDAIRKADRVLKAPKATGRAARSVRPAAPRARRASRRR